MSGNTSSSGTRAHRRTRRHKEEVGEKIPKTEPWQGLPPSGAGDLVPQDDHDHDNEEEHHHQHQHHHQQQPTWRMALYVRQPFEDNYVPPTFLGKLVTNADVSRPALLPTALATAVVTQEVSVVVLFLLAFMYASEGALPLRAFFAADVALLLGGYALTAWCCCSGSDGGSIKRSRRRDALLASLWCFLLFGAALRVLSPVLRTLTVSYSDDTIYALALLLLGVHLLLHDYSAGPAQPPPPPAPPAPPSSEEEDISTSVSEQRLSPPPPAATVTTTTPTHAFHGTVALNASMFAAVLLASRLGSNELVFCFTLLAVELFALSPMARYHARHESTALHVALTALLALAATAALYARDRTLLVLYGLTVGLVTLACPLCLVFIHRYKFTIQGPWDVASVESMGED